MSINCCARIYFPILIEELAADRIAGDLREAQENFARQAAIVISVSAKAGIQGLVYAVAGYDRAKEEVLAAYKMYVAAEARKYEREFSALGISLSNH